MSDETVTKKRQLSSTTSDADTSINITPIKDIQEEKATKTQRNKPKKKLKTTDMALEQKIEEINTKLSEMLTRKDKSFIKQILVDTLDEMKDKIIGSVMHRVEQLEGEIHDISIQQTKQNEKIEKITEENETLKMENKTFLERIKEEEVNRKYAINNLEQYTRRNNVRISGLTFDNKFETSQETAEGITTIFNDHMGLNLSPYDIDIAHRLGKYEDKKVRPIIVRFVQRQVKATVMRNTRKLKGIALSINEDLTKMNLEIVASIRLKGKDKYIKGWSYEGKIYGKLKSGKTETIEQSEYAKWLKLDWPKE